MSDSFLNILNEQQHKAVVCTEGPLLVLAGAGTGKTRVLTSRVAYIIAQNLAKPEEILAVTFTNKAANEMYQRISSTVESYGLNIGTFHSMAAKILRANVDLLVNNLNKNFTIIDEDEQVKLIKEILINQNIDIKHYTPKLIKSIISRWKDLSLLPNKLSPTDYNLPARKIAASVYNIYQETLLKNNVLDFGDLLLYNNELFKQNTQLLHYYQDKFKYILVDEYQDTNIAQYIWARMLATKNQNICCVGDDDQSIYSWRGAEVGNILRFEKDFPQAKIIKLEQNYRSTNAILHAASSIISYNTNRHTKNLWTTRTSEEKIKIVPCFNDKEEARFIVTEVEMLLKKQQIKIDQIAILVRASFQTRAFEEVLISNAIPYKIIGGFRFYERAEIKDVLAYIMVICNPNNNLALERIINTPRRSIGNTTLKNIKLYANDNNLSLLAAIKILIDNQLLKAKPAEELNIFLKQIENWRNNYNILSPAEATLSILKDSGYLTMLKNDNSDEAKNKVDNINELIKAINEFNDIYEFLEHASLIMDNDTLVDNFGGALNIMTLHASKGLEFDVVFLPGWEEGLFPNQKSLAEGDLKAIEEERRIAYVGITRAKQQLYITHANNRWMFNERITSIPSRFLEELPKEISVTVKNNRYLNIPINNYNTQKISIEKTANIDGLFPGKRIQHNKFGFGIIIKAYDDNLEIIFEEDKSIKRIKKDYITLA